MSEGIKNSIEINSNSENECEKEIDWKKTLSTHFSRPHEILQAERMWSMFCTHLRDLCPETQWISIARIEHSIDINLLNECEIWIESLVASAQWPFPEKIILTFNNQEHFKLKISLITDKKISFNSFSKTLAFTPESSTHDCSWVIEKKVSKKNFLQGEA